MKVTEEHFELFKAEIRKWIEEFGLKDYQLHFLLEKIDDRAEIRYNCVSGIAVFVLSTEWDEVDDSWLNVDAIKRTGFHEVCELLLGRLVNMADRRYDITEVGIEKETHRIIRILENVLWTK